MANNFGANEWKYYRGYAMPQKVMLLRCWLLLFPTPSPHPTNIYDCFELESIREPKA